MGGKISAIYSYHYKLFIYFIFYILLILNDNMFVKTLRGYFAQQIQSSEVRATVEAEESHNHQLLTIDWCYFIDSFKWYFYLYLYSSPLHVLHPNLDSYRWSIVLSKNQSYIA